MDEKQVASVLRILSDAYPSWNPSKTAAASWLKVLESFDGEAVEVAAIQYAQNNTEPPSVAQLIARVRTRTGTTRWTLSPAAPSAGEPASEQERKNGLAAGLAALVDPGALQKP